MCLWEWIKSVVARSEHSFQFVLLYHMCHLVPVVTCWSLRAGSYFCRWWIGYTSGAGSYKSCAASLRPCSKCWLHRTTMWTVRLLITFGIILHPQFKNITFFWSLAIVAKFIISYLFSYTKCLVGLRIQYIIIQCSVSYGNS